MIVNLLKVKIEVNGQGKFNEVNESKAVEGVLRVETLREVVEYRENKNL